MAIAAKATLLANSIENGNPTSDTPVLLATNRFISARPASIGSLVTIVDENNQVVERHVLEDLDTILSRLNG